jgi:hypothetical protein
VTVTSVTETISIGLFQKVTERDRERPNANTNLNFDDLTMNEAVIKLNEYQSKLNILVNKIKMYFFNDNCIE